MHGWGVGLLIQVAIFPRRKLSWDDVVDLRKADPASSETWSISLGQAYDRSRYECRTNRDRRYWPQKRQTTPGWWLMMDADWSSQQTSTRTLLQHCNMYMKLFINISIAQQPYVVSNASRLYQYWPIMADPTGLPQLGVPVLIASIKYGGGMLGGCEKAPGPIPSRSDSGIASSKARLLDCHLYNNIPEISIIFFFFECVGSAVPAQLQRG
jgi:hypothetical protein